jgi:DMSO reductase family type II enzyme chaperone
MNRESSSIRDEARVSTGATESLAARSAIYAVLARGFSYPDESVVDFFRGCSQLGLEEGGEFSSRFAWLVESVRSASAAELQAEYMKLFGPLGGLHPYETEQRKRKDFQKAQLMADVMGFYRAFGVEPDCDRPDHIASELEFMHYLILKERHAVLAGEPDNASLCRDAGAKFLREHLMTWTDEFVRSVREGDCDIGPLYGGLIDLFELFMEREKEELA